MQSFNDKKTNGQCILSYTENNLIIIDRKPMSENTSLQGKKFYLKDVSFINLMTHRVLNVLIVANPYDAFMLEDDGRVD